jgi:hypothetical protein
MHEPGVNEHAGNQRQIDGRSRRMKKIPGDRAEPENKIVDISAQGRFV